MGVTYYKFTPVEVSSKSFRGLPYVEKVDSIVDRLTAKQIDGPVHHDLCERPAQLDLAYRYD